MSGNERRIGNRLTCRYNNFPQTGLWDEAMKVLQLEEQTLQEVNGSETKRRRG